MAALFSADQLLFHPGNTQATVGQPTGNLLTRRARTHHHVMRTVHHTAHLYVRGEGRLSLC